MPQFIYQGEDKEISVFVRNENGTPHDLTGVTGILIYLYNRSGQIWMKYSLNAFTDHEDIEIVSLTGGELKIKVNAEDTRASDLGVVRGEIKLKRVNINFDDSDYETIASGAAVCEIKRPLTAADKTGY